MPNQQLKRGINALFDQATKEIASRPSTMVARLGNGELSFSIKIVPEFDAENIHKKLYPVPSLMARGKMIEGVLRSAAIEKYGTDDRIRTELTGDYGTKYFMEFRLPEELFDELQRDLGKHVQNARR